MTAARRAHDHLKLWGDRPRTRTERIRDRLGERVANWALIHLASFDYQLAIYNLMEAGREAARQERDEVAHDPGCVALTPRGVREGHCDCGARR